MTLAAADHQTSSQAANFIASIAAIEIPRNDWPELMHTLVEGVQNGQKSLKLGSYKAIEYICETVVYPRLRFKLTIGS
jgi:importin subunit beta-1